MSNIFVSHRSVDTKEAERLAGDLRSHGHDVWLDEWEIELGDSIVEKMDSGLSGATHLILCVSSSGVNSSWMGREWFSTLARQMNGLNVKVLPVILTGGEPPALVADLKFADLTSDWNKALAQILSAVR